MLYTSTCVNSFHPHNLYGDNTHFTDETDEKVSNFPLRASKVMELVVEGLKSDFSADS